VKLQASQLWDRIELREALLNGATTAPAISGCASFLAVLVFTQSVKVALASTATIAFIAAVVLAFFVVAGWQVGVIEGLCITVLVGIAVDYIIHMALSFNESALETVSDRICDAMREMGFTVIGAGITTAASSCMLLFCTLTLFCKVGMVMALNSVVGMFAALTLFPALLHSCLSCETGTLSHAEHEQIVHQPAAVPAGIVSNTEAEVLHSTAAATPMVPL